MNNNNENNNDIYEQRVIYVNNEGCVPPGYGLGDETIDGRYLRINHPNGYTYVVEHEDGRWFFEPVNNN